MPYKVLVVDDDPKNLKATKGFLEANGFDVTVTDSPAECMALLKDEFALVMMDYQMPEEMGDALVTKIKQKNPLQQVVMFSCDLSRDAVKQSLKAGAVDFLEKSSEPEEILKSITQYCNRFEMVSRTIRKTKDKNENRKIIERIGLIGQSGQMAELSEKIERLAEIGDVSVLVRGESGTGKELIARALHNLSPRSKGPFIAINCAAIPKELLESELFGHLKGSFTGADRDKDGKFVIANGGTIFLDEIGDMPIELQAKLLRVIQERVVEPIGARAPKKIDVRILSATHKNLDELVQNGLFRADLMYRIRVVEVEILPLRERIEDIEPLVAHFTTQFNLKNNTNKFFLRRTLEVLRKYSWPGNVRELGSVVEKHLIHAEDNVVKPDDLDLKLYENTNLISSDLTFAEFEKSQQKEKLEFIIKNVERAGSKQEAARRMGIKPAHLQYLLNDSKASRKAQHDIGTSDSN
jgi:DNA-binding NtrC family response regulator